MPFDAEERRRYYREYQRERRLRLGLTQGTRRPAANRVQRHGFEMAEAELPSVPRDTRDLTGRICGDPLPGRSALDRERLT